MEKYWQWIKSNLSEKPTTVKVELWLCTMIASWGFWLLLPEKTVEIPSYSLMGKIADDSAWGLVAVVLSLLRIWAIYKRSLWGRKSMSLVMTTFWIFVSLLVFFSEPPELGVPVYAMLALLSALVFLQLSWSNQP